jgi:eukaryotic-like serine/threonine-protein kinase
MQSGAIVGDRFTIREIAGEGGMGVVYRADELSTGKPVAIKVMHSGSVAEKSRFLREANVLASLSYPSIIACLGHGSLPTGEPWMAMEWCEGEDLATRLDRGPLAPKDALTVTRAIAGALRAAHERGIVHRDVKPGNIILEGGDPARARLIDFGLARIRDTTTSTMTGTLLGTPAYMAPEQIRAASEVDGRADLYALGVILFECLTGRRPFVSSDVLGVITQALFEPAPRVRDIDPTLSPALDSLIRSLLEKDPDQRFGTASSVLDALEARDLDHIASHPPPRMQPVGLTENELRYVSVVFIARKALHDASATDDTVLDRTEGQLIRCIERIAAPLHGRVEGLRDGTVLVAFSGRGAATDQAAMAARGALAIRDLGTGIQIALATGRASAEVGSLYSDAAVRAATLVESCPPDEKMVAIDETTRGLLDTRFSVEQRGGISFLIAEDPFGEAGRLLCGRPAPFVGREREVAFIEKVFDEVVNEPQAAAVLVVGEAGAGKSRLSREVLATLSRLERDTEIWVARGEAVRAGGSFGMLASALHRAAGIREGELVEVRQQKLAAFVQQRVETKRAASIVTFLGEIAETRKESDTDDDELRAARRDPVLMGDRIRLAFEDLVDAITQKHPLVFLLEDLHWGDMPSVKVLDLALRGLRSRPFFVFALGRPEMLEQFPALFAERSPHTMRLGGLSRKASQNLVRRVLGERATNEDIASIVERSAGHPLFLEELVRSIAEAASSGTTALPETVLAMVQSRVAKLPAEARRVLRAASVFGEVFWQGGIAMLLGPTDIADSLEAWLGVLCSREIVEAKRESTFPSEREYGFRHALFREAAYAMLTDEDKAVGHLLAGTFLEGRGETNALLLASHFDNANEPLRAAPYHVRAAREALLGGDHDAVLRHVDRIIESGTDGALLGEALAVKAEVLHWRGAYEQAGRLAESAMAKLEPGCNLWFSAMTTMAMVAVRYIHLDKLRDICQMHITWGEQNEWSDAFVEASIRIGLQTLIAGRHQVMQDLIRPLDAWFKNAKRSEPRMQALFKILEAGQTTIAWRYDETVECSFEAALLFEQLGDLRAAAGQRLDATFTLVDIGQYEKAIEVCNEVLIVADRLGISRLHSMAKLMRGAGLMGAGRFDEAVDVLYEAKKALDSLSDVKNSGSVRHKIGRCHRLRGEFDLAEAMLDDAEKMLAELPRIRAMCHANKALLYLEIGRKAEALEQAVIGMKLFEQLGRIGTDEILVRYAYVESLRQNGRRDDAAKELAAAKERVLWIANQFTSAEAKHTFLTNVDENRKVLAMEC